MIVQALSHARCHCVRRGIHSAGQSYAALSLQRPWLWRKTSTFSYSTSNGLSSDGDADGDRESKFTDPAAQAEYERIMRVIEDSRYIKMCALSLSHCLLDRFFSQEYP